MRWRGFSFLHLCCVLLFCFFISMSQSSDTNTNTNTSTQDSIDSTIRNHAFRALVRRRTGIIYDVPLPSNLSGIEASVLRIRSRSLWLEGANIKSFQIPPGILAAPPVRRLIIVYQNLGNWSAIFGSIQNYSLATPVFGLLAYHENATKVDFNVKAGAQIIVTYPRINSTSRGAKCITFGPAGSQRLDNLTWPNECSTRNAGHFAIVAAKQDQEALDPASMKKKKRVWVIWAVGFGCGVSGLVVLCLAGLMVAKMARRRRMEEMGRKAEEGEVLEMVWVSGSRMPSATRSRTQPVLEEGCAP